MKRIYWQGDELGIALTRRIPSQYNKYVHRCILVKFNLTAYLLIRLMLL